jgi:hypothetical protein
MRRADSAQAELHPTRPKGQVGAMLVERLTELQQKLTDGQLLDDAECFALISELWRLKASIASKLIERDVARDEAARTQAALDEANIALESLRRELDELKGNGGLLVCPLENRWSNCAIRIRKQAQPS